MAMGAFFSAMEVIPLLLLTFEAWRFMRLGGRKGQDSVLERVERRFPAQVGRDVPDRCGILEFPRGWHFRLSH